jgi:predicted transglutaminase-like protease
MNEFLSVKELVTILIAAYGAILSTFIFYKEQQKNKRKIKVNISTGYTAYVHGLSNFMVLLEFINPGFKTVTINSPELKIFDGKNIIMPVPNSNVAFPHSLEEGKSVHVWIDIEDLQKELIQAGYRDTVKLKGAIRDQTGKKFYSRKWLKISLQRSYN